MSDECTCVKCRRQRENPEPTSNLRYGHFDPIRNAEKAVLDAAEAWEETVEGPYSRADHDLIDAVRALREVRKS